MNRPRVSMMALVALSAATCAKPPLKQTRVVEAPAPGEVLNEMARRSGLSETELGKLVANCDLNQQTLYFCAFRDFVTRDLQLERARAEKERQLPLCKTEIGKKLTDLARTRDENCRASAEDEAGEGSMNLQIRARCASSTTERLIQRVEGVTDCNDLTRLSLQ